MQVRQALETFEKAPIGLQTLDGWRRPTSRLPPFTFAAARLSRRVRGVCQALENLLHSRVLLVGFDEEPRFGQRRARAIIGERSAKRQTIGAS